MIEAYVKSHIAIEETSLTIEQIDRLKESLTIPNPDKEVAIREHVRGAQSMPDTIELWGHDGIATFLLPRGIADQLEEVLDEEVYWHDFRADHPIDTSDWSAPTLFDYQEPAVVEMVTGEQGVYQAPAAAGKTVTMLEAVRRIGQRALVVVNSTHIAAQWADRAREHLGLARVGIIGDAKWEEEDLTVAVQQTLWSRRDELGSWWDDWGLVCLDECHHVPATTFYDIIQRFPARYRLGLSATPDKQVGRERLVRASLGPTLHATPRGTLVSAGRIVDPTVRFIQSNFSYVLWPTHRAQKDPDTGLLVCEYARRGCDRKGLRHQNNYAELVKELIDDDARNDLISDAIVRAYGEGRAIIVLSRRLGHLDNLARRVVAQIGQEDVYRLSGKEKTATRMDIYERAEEGKLVIFATVGDEALDIPRLDTIVLAFPSKNEGLIEQQIGRVARTHPGKAAPLVIDVTDDVPALDKQLRQRVKVYRRQGLKMVYD